MDFLFEELIEILLEIIIDGSFGALESKKCPFILRILAVLLIAAVYGGLLGVIGFIGFVLLRDGAVVGGIIVFACDLAVLALMLFEVRKIIRKRAARKNSDNI